MLLCCGLQYLKAFAEMLFSCFEGYDPGSVLMGADNKMTVTMVKNPSRLTLETFQILRPQGQIYGVLKPHWFCTLPCAVVWALLLTNHPDKMPLRIIFRIDWRQCHRMGTGEDKSHRLSLSPKRRSVPGHGVQSVTPLLSQVTTEHTLVCVDFREFLPTATHSQWITDRKSVV